MKYFPHIALASVISLNFLLLVNPIYSSASSPRVVSSGTNEPINKPYSNLNQVVTTVPGTTLAVTTAPATTQIVTTPAVTTPASTTSPATSTPCQGSGIHATISGNSATFYNNTGSPVEVGVASYQIYGPSIDTQTLFSSATGTVPTCGILTLSIATPSCAYQFDAFTGPVLSSFVGQRYGNRLLANIPMSNSPYCTTPTPPVTTAPVTTAPVTTVPSTTEPVTTAPSTTEPGTTVPATTAPQTTVTVTTAPSTTTQPVTAPTTTSPATSVPTTGLPATTGPGTTGPGTTTPASNLPATAVPDTTIPGKEAPTTAPATTTIGVGTTTPETTVVYPTTVLDIEKTPEPVNVQDQNTAPLPSSPNSVVNVVQAPAQLPQTGLGSYDEPNTWLICLIGLLALACLGGVGMALIRLKVIK